MKNLLLMTTLFLISCSPSLESILENNKMAVETRLSQIEKVVSQVSGLPTIRADSIQKIDGPTPDFYHDVPALVSGDDKTIKSRNAVIMHEEDLLDLAVVKKDKLTLSFDKTINEAASLVRKGKMTDGKPPYKNDTVELWYFEPLKYIKYLVVIRTHNYTKPEVVGGSKFIYGRYSGEALMFDIDKNLYLGGVSFNAMNDDTVKVNVSNVESWVRSNLWEKSRAALYKKLKSQIPNVRLP